MKAVWIVLAAALAVASGEGVIDAQESVRDAQVQAQAQAHLPEQRASTYLAELRLSLYASHKAWCKMKYDLVCLDATADVADDKSQYIGTTAWCDLLKICPPDLRAGLEELGWVYATSAMRYDRMCIDWGYKFRHKTSPECLLLRSECDSRYYELVMEWEASLRELTAAQARLALTAAP
jgi:hypothetical protein